MALKKITNYYFDFVNYLNIVTFNIYVNLICFLHGIDLEVTRVFEIHFGGYNKN